MKTFGYSRAFCETLWKSKNISDYMKNTFSSRNIPSINQIFVLWLERYYYYFFIVDIDYYKPDTGFNRCIHQEWLV